MLPCVLATNMTPQDYLLEADVHCVFEELSFELVA